MYGDCGLSALEDIRNMSTEVLLPVIWTVAKHAEWSDTLAHQITDNANRFASDGRLLDSFLFTFLVMMHLSTGARSIVVMSKDDLTYRRHMPLLSCSQGRNYTWLCQIMFCKDCSDTQVPVWSGQIFRSCLFAFSFDRIKQSSLQPMWLQKSGILLDLPEASNST